MPPESTDALSEALRENQEIRKSLEQLRAAFAQLEIESKEHLSSAQSARAQLQQFVYAASHDFQEPLRSILSYGQLIERHSTADPLTREYAAFIMAGATRMKDLLRDLLTYSRAGSTQRRSRVQLSSALQWARLKLAAEIIATSAQITHGDLPEVIADEAQIAHVFENLLSNSLKFRSAVTPQINIEAEQGSDECQILVRDNGIGIDPRCCEEVLLPFKRLRKEVAGNGLGLAICEKIVRAHNGRLWLESDGTSGTMVRFTLPT